MTDTRSQVELYLSKSLKVILPDTEGQTRPEVVATIAKNLQSLGFGLKKPVLERLASSPERQVIDWYESILPMLQEMTGAHRTFKPMYPNFPRQVMEASDAELYLNATIHYLGFMLSDLTGNPDLVLLPSYQKEDRPALSEFHQLRWIGLGSEEDFDAIFTRTVASNASLSPSDKEILHWFVAHRDIEPLLPASIPQKETLASLVAAMPNPQCLVPVIQTATDVLRVAVAMSEGDVSLAEPTKFRNFSKRERRFLLNCLEQVGASRTEDMLRWKDRWIRLGERLHPGDFNNRFPQSLASFDVLRNGEPFQTFNSKVEQAMAASDAKETVELLCQRPGDFARRLDHVLRRHANQLSILEAFLRVAPKVSTPVLLQAWSHFEHRASLKERAFFPKGNAAKVQLQEEPPPPLAEEISQAAAQGIRAVLVGRFGRLPKLGKVFLDARLKDQFVPFAQRSASRSLRCITRGSRFVLPAGSTLRFFCWWHNIDDNDEEHSRVDLDLSASFFDSDWQVRGDVSYYNLREGQCYHSGDITSAPEGACEFIDVNLASVLELGARYVVMSVLSFTRQPFLSLPECFAGWMIRQRPNSGEVFEPKTVQDKIDITSPATSCVPVIIDAEERLIYWADLGLKSMGQLNNAARNSVGFSQIGRAIINLRKSTLYDLFLMHVEGRGEFVSDLEEADFVFGLYEGNVTAFDSNKIISDFIS